MSESTGVVAGMHEACWDRRTMPSVILVVGDDALRDSLRILLEPHFPLVETYGSIENFLTAFHAGRQRCVVVDHNLPDAAGIGSLDVLRKRGLRLPVVAISGWVDAATRRRAREAGAAAVIEMPMDEMELVDAIRGALADSA